MLPETYHSGDERWLKEVLEQLTARIGISRVKILCEKYTIAYCDAYEREEENHRKDGKARFEANSRLVSYIKKLDAKIKLPTAI